MMKKRNSYLIIRDMLAVREEILTANLIAEACNDPCAMAPEEFDELRDEIAYLKRRIGGDIA